MHPPPTPPRMSQKYWYRSCLYAVQFIFISSGYINLFIRLIFFFSLNSAETRDLPRNSCFLCCVKLLRQKKFFFVGFFFCTTGKGWQCISLNAKHDRQKGSGRGAEGHCRNGFAFWIYPISQTFEKGEAPTRSPAPSALHFLSWGQNVTGCCTDFKNISQRNKKKKKHIQQKWTKRKKKKSQPTGRDTRRLSFVKKTNTSINYRLLSFTGGIFLCFNLLPIVKAVVNIFILSFCVLKLSCKGSCYINV